MDFVTILTITIVVYTVTQLTLLHALNRTKKKTADLESQIKVLASDNSVVNNAVLSKLNEVSRINQKMIDDLKSDLALTNSNLSNLIGSAGMMEGPFSTIRHYLNSMDGVLGEINNRTATLYSLGIRHSHLLATEMSMPGKVAVLSIGSLEDIGYGDYKSYLEWAASVNWHDDLKLYSQDELARIAINRAGVSEEQLIVINLSAMVFRVSLPSSLILTDNTSRKKIKALWKHVEAETWAVGSRTVISADNTEKADALLKANRGREDLRCSTRYAKMAEIMEIINTYGHDGFVPHANVLAKSQIRGATPHDLMVIVTAWGILANSVIPKHYQLEHPEVDILVRFVRSKNKVAAKAVEMV